MIALFRLLIAAFAVITIALNALLLVFCHSKAGVVFGLGGLSFGGAFLLAALAWSRRLRKLWSAAGLAFAGWVVATGWLALYAPTGQTPPDAPVSNRYVGGRDGFRRYALGNLLPEGDQFAFGFRLVPALDPLFTNAQAKRLSAFTASIYAELEADPSFHALGSVMPDAYAQISRRPFDRGHYFLYIPKELDRTKPRPVLIFLHGSGGNFKAYTWLLRQVADELGMILIAPSYGFGNWHEPDSTRVVRDALGDAAKVTALDPGRVHLMGLSNGGLGVSQVGRSLGGQLRSLTFISPVLHSDSITSREFQERWRDRPILVITGGIDDRVPLDYVGDGSATMHRAGARVTFRIEKDADHFMLFSHRALVIKVVTDWLRKID